MEFTPLVVLLFLFHGLFQSFAPSLLPPSGSHYGCKQMLQPGLFTSSTPSDVRWLQTAAAVYTPADRCSVSGARFGISIMREQGDCSSPASPCLSDSLPLCSLWSLSSFLSFPPSNNIFQLSAVPRRLQCKEIRGRHNYRWGKLRHCLLEANWILTETAG